MKKLIPILMLCFSAGTLALVAVGIVAFYAASDAPRLILVAMPIIIIALICSYTLAAFSFLFKRDIICKISFAVNVSTFVISFAVVIIWLAA